MDPEQAATIPTAAAAKKQSVKSSLDGAEQRYAVKHRLLRSKTTNVIKCNNKLRNRLYHIKKEIKYLKRLKRILIQRLIVNGDRFMDTPLEIPDSEPGSTVEDQIIAQVAQSVADSVREEQQQQQQQMQQQQQHQIQQQQQQPQTHPTAPAMVAPSPPVSVASIPVEPAAPPPPRVAIISKAESRRRSAAMLKSLSDDAKASVADIISSVISESRAERVRQRMLDEASNDDEHGDSVAADKSPNHDDNEMEDADALEKMISEHEREHSEFDDDCHVAVDTAAHSQLVSPSFDGSNDGSALIGSDVLLTQATTSIKLSSDEPPLQ